MPALESGMKHLQQKRVFNTLRTVAHITILFSPAKATTKNAVNDSKYAITLINFTIN